MRTSLIRKAAGAGAREIILVQSAELRRRQASTSTIAEICSMWVALATALITRTGSWSPAQIQCCAESPITGGARPLSGAHRNGSPGARITNAFVMEKGAEINAA